MIYADINSSYPILPEVRDYLKKRMDSEFFGNPNSLHNLGKK
ncbi:MAG: hypothetical protein ACD_79C00053G0007, partial [uncultured bacterium]